MSEAAGIDSVFLERAMPKPYSVDLHARVIEDVETGASRREAAERYGISPSVVVIWVQRFEETGSVAAKPSGGKRPIRCGSSADQLGEMGPSTGPGDLNSGTPQKMCAQF